MDIKDKITKFIRNNMILIVSLGILFIVIAFFGYQNQNPNSLNGQLRKADNFAKQGKLASALSIYNDIVRKYPQSYDAHYLLGNLYRQVQEPEKAKIEYFRAINLGVVNKYEASFALADIYEKEGNYAFSEKLLKSLEDINNSKIVKEKLGLFYLDLGKKIFLKDKVEGLKNYKIAYNYLKEADSKQISLAKKALENSYSKIADVLLAGKKQDDAVKLLNSSLKLFDNAEAHYKLGKIYEYEDLDKAISEYEKAFSLNPYIGNKDNLAHLLTARANELKQHGKIDEANELYNKAKSYVNNNFKPTKLPDQDIIVNIISRRFYEDKSKDILSPGITFKVINAGKNEIKYLKAKVVFWVDDEIKYKKEQSLVSYNDSLKPDGSTEEINIFSSKPITDTSIKHNIKIEVFLSKKQPDRWELYRNAYMIKKGFLNNFSDSDRN